MVLGLGKAKGLITLAVIGLGLAFAIPLATQIPRVYRGTLGLIEQVAGGIAGATQFVSGIGESVTTTICNYDFFILIQNKFQRVLTRVTLPKNIKRPGKV